METIDETPPAKKQKRTHKKQESDEEEEDIDVTTSGASHLHTENTFANGPMTLNSQTLEYTPQKKRKAKGKVKPKAKAKGKPNTRKQRKIDKINAARKKFAKGSKKAQGGTRPRQTARKSSRKGKGNRRCHSASETKAQGASNRAKLLPKVCSVCATMLRMLGCKLCMLPCKHLLFRMIP